MGKENDFAIRLPTINTANEFQSDVYNKLRTGLTNTCSVHY